MHADVIATYRVADDPLYSDDLVRERINERAAYAPSGDPADVEDAAA